MYLIPAGEIRSVLHYRMLIERLRQAFRAGCETPEPVRYVIPTWGQSEAALSLTPACHRGHAIGVRLDTAFPDNPRHDLPVVNSCYLLCCGKTGVLQAILDGRALTTHRAAATAALAASYLARPDAERLLVVGTGALAPHLIEAYAVVRPLRQVLVWGRNRSKAEKIAARFRRGAFRAAATDDLEGAVRGADIVSCATGTTEPVIRGEWLAPGAHLDLIGSTTPEAREADDETIGRARVFVDCRTEASRRTGDIAQPLASGVLSPDDIAGDLFEVTRGERSGRRFYDQITLFKSVGIALADLTAAELAAEMVVHNETLR